MKYLVVTLYAFSLLFAAGAQAAVVYDNLGAPSDGADTFADQGPNLADSFSASSAFAFSELQLLLQAGSFPDGSPIQDGNTISVDLFDSTYPGGFRTNLGIINDDNLSVTPGVVDLLFSSPISLDAGRYWIQLSSPDGSTAAWAWSTEASGTGVANEFFSNGGGISANIAGPYQMRVIGTLATAFTVPEPLTLSLFGAGLIGAAAFRRRSPK